ncbi:hypothetical protein BAU15_06600 [Enterococcus sp. JM4C]|uniref:helix-turn-helix domain-containing protein n=1 Tax=Candidatus Enterococcus huntleyi TaxID=1857217 RepID=UPI001379D910|nr:helix-turn-helix transcriptional regulator [Enterococcus sp. JM4C]KAF1297213.1 hypothetical protein BAU15_06600 [Enterococcus sp. JM4C]
MYYPIQIPYVLDQVFLQQMDYRETVIDELSEFVICYWQMRPINENDQKLDNIIIIDGCIDLIVDFKEQIIGFSGMSQTDFHSPIQLPAEFMGSRMLPGAFHQLTGLPANEAMDAFLPLSRIYPDFDSQTFFSLTFDEAKQYLIDYMVENFSQQTPNDYTTLFPRLIQEPPASVNELCHLLNKSQSQCQRDFKKNYGLSPKVVLSTLRFQQALTLLTTEKMNAGDLLALVQYYDQSHFINDFKRHIGLTPMELISHYQS